LVSDASEYTTGDYVRIRSEVLEITGISGDTLTVVRGQFNTIATEHTDGDTVQLCLHYDGIGLVEILTDLLTTFAGVDPAFIPAARWNAEVSAFLPGLLSALITEPVGIQSLLK
jgi:hypothetical protein